MFIWEVTKKKILIKKGDLLTNLADLSRMTRAHYLPFSRFKTYLISITTYPKNSYIIFDKMIDYKSGFDEHISVWIEYNGEWNKIIIGEYAGVWDKCLKKVI